jgi:hypothetical protein
MSSDLMRLRSLIDVQIRRIYNHQTEMPTWWIIAIVIGFLSATWSSLPFWIGFTGVLLWSLGRSAVRFARRRREKTDKQRIDMMTQVPTPYKVFEVRVQVEAGDAESAERLLRHAIHGGLAAVVAGATIEVPTTYTPSDDPGQE